MPKQNKRRASRVKNLIVICTLSAIVLSVSTYAWFIGMQTVAVSSFDVEIAVTDSLKLSLDGDSWENTVSISKETLDEVSYTGHTNSWGGEAGLFPVSSVGEMDSVASRMMLFEKASLTATPGGYRLLASRVKNYDGQPEQDGYVAFDLFIKNYSGTQYIGELNELDEEAIYLTTDSAVTVGLGGVEDTGIENSVRVAFAQIGRVAATEDNVDKITGITCTDNVEDGVTGICRTAQIWEPNDKAHHANAISWYETSCRARTGVDVTLAASYDGACNLVEDGIAYPTYAVSEEITSADNVDIYDGVAYNTYTDTTQLYAFPYFTDTMKELTGTARPKFMTLAPNSITKVRVYIYLEGQDVDNYDFASIGRQIAVNFGFTKQRFTQEDIDYDGPDMQSPIITLLGDDPMTVALDGTYTDPGATALDYQDGNLTSDIIIDSSAVDTSAAGTYSVTYTVTDSDGNTTVVTREVVVE